MMRVLGIELRRSTAPAAGAVTALLGVAGLYLLVTSGQSDLWDTQWLMLAFFQRIMLVVLWPLALGAGAWQARRDRRSGTTELLATTARPVWQRVLPTSGAMAIGLAAGYAVTLAVGAVRVAGNAGYFDFGWLAVAGVGALSLVAAGWLGMGVGRLFPSAYTPPALVVAGFLLLIVPVQLGKTGPVDGVALLVPSFATTIDEFTTVAASVTVAQAIWFVALAVGGLLVAMVRRRSAVFGLLPIVVGVVVAVPVLDSGPALRPDPAANAQVCTHDGGPLVCVAAAHARLLPTLTGPAREALRRLAVLPDAPTSVHEVTGSRMLPQPADQVWFDSDNVRPGGIWAGTADELVVRVLAGAGTRPCDDQYQARAVAAAWLYGRLDAPGPTPEPSAAAERQRLWRALTALPVSVQRQRIEALRTAERTCRPVNLSGLLG